MKKTMAVVVMLAAALSLVSAKSSKKYSFTAGAHALAGVGFGTFDADWEKTIKDNANMSKGIGIDVGGGAWINFPLVQGLCIQPEVNYMYNMAQASYKGTTAGLTTDRNNVCSYSSIDVAALFTYKVQSINFLVGPTVSFPISDFTVSRKGSQTIGNTSTAIDETNTYTIDTTATFGFQAGANTNVRFGLGQIVAGARFMMDFTPIQRFNKNSNGEITSKDDLYKRMGVIAEVGYRFAL